MLVRTSPEGMVKQLSSDPPELLLYDFDIDGADLKPEHRKWLHTKVAVPLSKDEWHKAHYYIVLRGSASPPGNPAHNMTLSRQRAKNVEKYIGDKLKSLPVSISAEGETIARTHGMPEKYESMWYRSVAVYVRYRPGIIDPALPRPETYIYETPVIVGMRPKLFKIRLLFSFGGSSGVGVPGLSFGLEGGKFDIWDVSTSLKQTYDFLGHARAFGLDLKGPSPIVSPTVTLTGEWNVFEGHTGVSVNDFEGPFIMESLPGISRGADSIGGYTILSFGPPSKWYALGPGFKIWGFKSGTSIGLPGISLLTEVKGTLKLTPPARTPEPYRGD